MDETIINAEKDKKLITNAYRQLLRSIKTDMDETDRLNIRKSYELAVKAHSKQRRKSGEPYILHPIEVARICSEEIGLGPTAIVAALLHDVVEDTEISLEQINEMFGDRISLIVDGLTKLDGLGRVDVESPQAENFKKVLKTLTQDVRVVLIKMADRLHNMRTLGAMPRHKQLKIAAETTFIYAPLAHRLGLYNIKTEFQDLSMKINEPETYQEITTKIKDTDAERTLFIKEFISPLTDQLNEIGVPYRIHGRPKSVYSIWNKMRKKKVKFEEIYDLFAVRIIIDVQEKKEKPLCWEVYSIVTDVHTPIPERLKDWITTPKSNGYESLHTTVIGPQGRYVEVQIRSERMNDIAEKGFAAHWKYKGISGSPDVYDTWLNSVREILDNKDSDAIEMVNDFTNNLFTEEVYVYTPKGDTVILPKGATALDFAFSVHSDVGYHCFAIKINNKLEKMGYKLQNGDQIAVETNKNQKPNEAWLKMVVTGKARSKIRSAMKEERRKQGEFGKEALARKLKNLKVDFENTVDNLVRHFDFKSRVDLYFEIAAGNINLQEFSKIFAVEGGKLIEIPEAVIEKNEAVVAPKFNKINRKTKFSNKPRLVIAGQIDDIEYSLATCCNPVQGDDIFAYVTAGSGLKIHRTTCANSTHMMAHYGDRIKKAEWITSSSTSFVADLVITGVDDGIGVIERLSHNISTTLGLNIRSFSIAGDEGYFEGKVSVLVSNKDQLTIAIRALQNLDGISTVERVD